MSTQCALCPWMREVVLTVAPIKSATPLMSSVVEEAKAMVSTMGIAREVISFLNGVFDGSCAYWITRGFEPWKLNAGVKLAVRVEQNWSGDDVALTETED